MNQLLLKSAEIECDGCARSIQKVLSEINGVKSVEVDVPQKKISVSFDPPADEASIQSALEDAGFPPEKA